MGHRRREREEVRHVWSGEKGKRWTWVGEKKVRNGREGEGEGKEEEGEGGGAWVLVYEGTGHGREERKWGMAGGGGEVNEVGHGYVEKGD